MLNTKKGVYKHTEKLGGLSAENFDKKPTYPQHLIQPLLNLYTYMFRESLGGKLEVIQKLLLVILILILPWNLGKHIDGIYSFVDGFFIPYLIPTIYLQDVLVVFLLVLGFFSRRFVPPPTLQTVVVLRLLFLFVIACFLSMFYSGRVVPSVYILARLLLYLLFFIFSARLFIDLSVRRAVAFIVILNILLLSVLGVVQFCKQASVFSNYLYFGEQPYSAYTAYIAKESYGGIAKVPPYGTFMHPNILAGFLVVLITLAVGCVYRRLAKGGWQTWLLIVTIVVSLGLYVLYLTKSYTAWAVLLMGAALLRVKLAPIGVVLLGVAVVLFGLLFPVYKTQIGAFLPGNTVLSQLSAGRRSDLLLASYKMFLVKPLHGWGINSFTYSFEPYYNRRDVVRFLQPVHNVYALILSEVGLFGMLIFISATFYPIYYSARYGNYLYSVILLQMIFLSSFDHYFFTIHQTYLLFILTLMLTLTYTKSTDCL